MFLTGNFELGVGRGVEGTRENHPTPSYKAKSHFQIGTKNLSKSEHPTLSRKKNYSILDFHFFFAKKNEIYLGNELGF